MAKEGAAVPGGGGRAGGGKLARRVQRVVEGADTDPFPLQGQGEGEFPQPPPGGGGEGAVHPAVVGGLPLLHPGRIGRGEAAVEIAVVVARQTADVPPALQQGGHLPGPGADPHQVAAAKKQMCIRDSYL